MAKLKEILDQKILTTRRALLGGAVLVLGLVVLNVIVIQAWEYSNSTPFCANLCHDLHPEEAIAHQNSSHARVRCAECHLDRASTLHTVLLKVGHLQHLPATLTHQYGRPLRWETLRPSNQSCERCHWPPAYQGDQVREVRRFRSDEDNTEKRTVLILKIGGGQKNERNGEGSYGIHWHALNTVEYITTDERRQDIPWMQVSLPDDRTVEYNDVTDPLSAEEIAVAEKRTMDCVDCHNQVGHPFPSLEQLIDDALAKGQLSHDLLLIKKEMLALLTASYASQEEALAAVESWKAQYKATYPEVAASPATAIEQAGELAQGLLSQLVFDRPGITWQAFIELIFRVIRGALS